MILFVTQKNNKIIKIQKNILLNKQSLKKLLVSSSSLALLIMLARRCRRVAFIDHYVVMSNASCQSLAGGAS